MTPDHLDRVFGRGRLKMVTGEHVEVFREAVAPGERRRYTKRFLKTRQGDFGQWTEREWRILARLIGHGVSCVPDVVQYDRGRETGAHLVQTYDAGVTVDQWATLLPVARGGRIYRHVFEDCAHWWALAHHCLVALNEIHPLELVHLDIKGDNVCIPYSPVSFDPGSDAQPIQPLFAQLSLIDFAFALVSRESLTTPLPIGWQRDYDYQSPRLLAALEAGHHGDLTPTRELDWRCDMYSLAAMLKRYLPDENVVSPSALAAGWLPERYNAAKQFILRLRDIHDQEIPQARPHRELLESTRAVLAEDELAQSLQQQWMLARETRVVAAPASPLTPVTLLAPPVRATRSGRVTAVTVVSPEMHDSSTPPLDIDLSPRAVVGAPRAPREQRRSLAGVVVMGLIALGAALAYVADRTLFADAETIESEAAAAAASSIPAPAGALASAGDAASPAQPADTSAGDVDKTPAASPENAAATAVPSGPAPAIERDAAPSGGQAVTSSRGSSGARSKPSPASRSASRSARNPPAAPPSTARAVPSVPVAQATPSAPVAQARRPLPSWVSLEPPAWHRSGNAPMPPGTAAQESRSRGEAPSAEAARAEPDIVARTQVIAVPPTPTPATKPAVDDQKKIVASSAPKPGLFSSPSSAPIEERSETLNLASASTSPARPAPLPPSSPKSAPPEQRSVPDYAAKARRMIEDTVPRFVAQAEPEISYVLWLASTAYHPMQDRAVADAARAARIADDTSLPVRLSAAEARRLNEDARTAWASRRNAAEALDLQLQAFGANPRDPEIAGNLAVFYLRQKPAQAQMARQMALFALGVRGREWSATRLEDWHTLAVANALAGREADATKALYVTLSMSGNAESRCIAALESLANYGERLRVPVDALFSRMRAQGRGFDSPACSWPSNWSVRRLF